MISQTDTLSQNFLSIKSFKRGKIGTSQTSWSTGYAARLPHELFYGLIIPHLFSEYLHQVIVYDKREIWNPFIHLPLVCKEFQRSCRSLIYRIFDVRSEEADATQIIRELLSFTLNLWRKARKLPLFKRPQTLPIPPTYANLMSSQSLIQIYICTGYAKYYYTVDVLNPLSLDRLWITGWIEGYDRNELQGDTEIGIPDDFLFRPFKMADDRVHRVFLPLTCAMKLCDLIQPDGLASHIADHLAQKAVKYATEPILLKHVQDLEMNMARKYGLPLYMWSKWTKDTLKLINDRHVFLTSVQESGELVKKYIRPSELSRQTIRNTRVLDVLRVVSLVDWGADTEDIRKDAYYILEDLLFIYNNGAAWLDENDEYLVQDDRNISFSEIIRIPTPSS